MGSSRGCVRDAWRPLTRRKAGAGEVVSKGPMAEAGVRARWKACTKSLDTCSDLGLGKGLGRVLTEGYGARGSVACREGSRRARQ